jgi:hypothetical protein
MGVFGGSRSRRFLSGWSNTSNPATMALPSVAARKLVSHASRCLAGAVWSEKPEDFAALDPDVIVHRDRPYRFVRC